MNHQDDWIEQQIRKLAEAVARIAGLRSSDDAEVRSEIDDAFRKLTGLDARWADALGASGLRAAAGNDPRKLVLIADLLRLDADLLRREGDADGARAQDALAEAVGRNS